MSAPPKDDVIRELDRQIEYWTTIYKDKVQRGHIAKRDADHRIACLEEAKRLVSIEGVLPTAQDIFGE